MKPYCHHSYHYYCMTQIINILQEKRKDIYEKYNEKNQYDLCLIDENINSLFKIKKPEAKRDVLGEGINQVINTIESAINPVQKVGQGIKGVFDQIITFGQIESEREYK